MKIHPAGDFYFYTDRRAPRYVTFANLYKPAILDQIKLFMSRMDQDIEEQLQHQQTGLPDDVEVCLELLPEGDWGYYMVDHHSRSLFWLEELDTTWIAGEVNGLASLSHLSKITCCYNFGSTKIRLQNTF